MTVCDMCDQQQRMESQYFRGVHVTGTGASAHSYGALRYSCQYLNDPHKTQRVSLRSSGWLFRHAARRQLRVLHAVDPAASVFKAGGGVATDSDYTALVTIAVNPEGDIYVVDVVCDRLGVDELSTNWFRVVETITPSSGY